MADLLSQYEQGIDKTVMMKCGHAANAVRQHDKAPVCVICIGTTPDAAIVMEETPDLTGRKARCSYYGRNARHGVCHSEVNSKFSLPFFEHKPKSPHDEYYCGCWGWD